MNIRQITLTRSKPIIIKFLGIFFDRSNLKGKYFERRNTGIKWALQSLWTRNILRLGRTYPWPVSIHCTIGKSDNIIFHPDDLNNFQSPGTYFQNYDAKIYIGHGTYIGPNVGIITSNHDFNNLEMHTPGKDVHIGHSSWIGMNAIILPGVVLGEKTIVAAGSVVTRSFPKGKVLIGGVPAKVLREINVEDSVGVTEDKAGAS